MASFPDDRPAVTRFDDHEVIVPANPLKSALEITGRETPEGFDPVARAEAALAQLSSEFSEWMQSECDQLDAMRDKVRRQGLGDSAGQELFRAAHDIKGQAATLGYPLAADAADSLCRLIEHSPDPERVPLSLIDQHVDGVRAIIREDARADGNRTAVALATTLRHVTDDFLVQVNAGRPGYLNGIVAPPLAPKD